MFFECFECDLASFGGFLEDGIKNLFLDRRMDFQFAVEFTKKLLARF